MSVVLSIDIFDPCGGTATNAAIKTIHALGGYACAALTAVSVQTPNKVVSVNPVDANIVKDQLAAIKDTYPVNAVLLGMLPNKEIIDVVGDFLDENHDDDLFVVVDPVMINQMGHQFLEKKDIDAMKRRLLLHADLITPNIYETEHLTGVVVETRENAEQAAEMLMTLGCRSVLIKEESRSKDQIFDLFLDDENFYVIESPILESKNVIGAGTTLAAAIAVSVASGMPMENAISGARSYLAQAIQSGCSFVKAGDLGPVEHFV